MKMLCKFIQHCVNVRYSFSYYLASIKQPPIQPKVAHTWVDCPLNNKKRNRKAQRPAGACVGLLVSGRQDQGLCNSFGLCLMVTGGCFISSNQVLFLGRKKEGVPRTYLQLSPPLLWVFCRSSDSPAYVSLASFCHLTIPLCKGDWEM